MPKLKPIRGPTTSNDKVFILNDFQTRKKIKRLIVTIKLPSSILKSIDTSKDSSLDKTSTKKRSNSKSSQPKSNKDSNSNSNTYPYSQIQQINTPQQNIRRNETNIANDHKRHPHTMKGKSTAFTEELRKIDDEINKILKQPENQAQMTTFDNSQVSNNTQTSTQSGQEYKILPSNVLSVLEDEIKELNPDEEKEEDDEFLIDKIIFSLKDPLGGSRIKLPVKSLHCKHFDCFDFENFCLFNKLPEMIKDLTKKTLFRQNYEKLSRNQQKVQQQQQPQQPQNQASVPQAQHQQQQQQQQHRQQHQQQYPPIPSTLPSPMPKQSPPSTPYPPYYHHQYPTSQQQLPFQPAMHTSSQIPITSTNQPYPTSNTNRHVIIPQLRLAPYVTVLNNDGTNNNTNNNGSNGTTQYSNSNQQHRQVSINRYTSNFVTPTYQACPFYKCPICDVNFQLNALTISETFNFFVQRTPKEIDKIELIGLKKYRTIDSTNSYKTKSPSNFNNNDGSNLNNQNDKDLIITLSSDDEDDEIYKQELNHNNKKMKLGNIMNGGDINNKKSPKRNLSLWKQNHFDPFDAFKDKGGGGDGSSWDDPVVLD
ncbi:uncharacterized protein KGF55_001210 [Candida pseudojiufengensis]|uniref:uncharacterized protein n=1 Tax=Candida pseudojiufengensis TaxID=497109 RepID=UPI002224DEEB|nr:uncharacterized protein KGF55_001210 [Candida pseudojiufengensis]KAI5965847.1 hypothetical protein KGF55_001210 [Candida pseudojiufengensis]